MDRLYDLQCEYKKNPMVLDAKHPRFSWKIQAEGKDITQKEWELTIWEKRSGQMVWQASEANNKTLHIEYQGKPLKENKAYCWRVTSKLSDGRILESKETAYFETGLWNQDIWKGIWIGKKTQEDLGICPYFRKRFTIEKPYERARVFMSALGLYEISINGVTRDEYLFAPGWTNYQHHQQYLAYDITEQLKQGENVMGVRIGDGWYRGDISFDHVSHFYGEDSGFAAILILESGDEKRIITTDSTWKTADSGVISSSIYNGELYDLTKEEENWNCCGYDDSKWHRADTLANPKTKMVAMINEGTKRMDYIKPKEVIQTPNGDTIIDMGQNMTGWVRVKVKGKEGDVVSLKHGEVLDKDGNFYSGNLRLAKQEATYILRDGEQVLEPHFTFHGFRYIKILKFPVEVTLDCFEGIVLHTAMKQTIHFTSSNELVNQLQHNLVWGQKGNFLDVPTDCPQRDERMGWTGDAQIFCRTACYNFGGDSFFTKWLEDVKADQYDNGAIPFVVPNVLPKDWGFLTEAKIGWNHTSAAWGDAITVCPWTLYQQYGDVRILENTYDSMKKYIDYIYHGAHHGSGDPYLWDWGPQLGDWLALDSEEGSYRGATDETFIATAYYAYSVEILSKCSKVLGKDEDYHFYTTLYEKIKERFKETYLENNRIQIETQTAQLVPLYFGLLNGEEEKHAIKKLISLIREHNDHLTTGFVGTPYLCHVLTKYGYNDIAYTLLLQQDFPSWLYQVTKGATTIWEHWDGQKPDGTFWSDNMNSFNHYAYGSIGEWLYRCMAGIDVQEDAPGFSHIVIRPQSDERLSEVSCAYDSVRGEIKSAWKRKGGVVRYYIEIPANTKATIYLEDGSIYKVGSGIYEYCVNLT